MMKAVLTVHKEASCFVLIRTYVLSGSKKDVTVSEYKDVRNSRYGTRYVFARLLSFSLSLQPINTKPPDDIRSTGDDGNGKKDTPAK
jgi:hypothetical protein